MEIGRLDAVNPPHALVCKYIDTQTELFLLVGDNCMNFGQSILPKDQKRRNKSFEKVDLSLTANRDVLGSNPTKGEKSYH